MKVVYDDKRLLNVKINVEKVEALLRSQGVKQGRIDRLTIHLAYQVSEVDRMELIAHGEGANPFGLHVKPSDIFIYGHDRTWLTPSLNGTLLHELRHFIKGGYRPGEASLPHAQRPSEIDAYRFEAMYQLLWSLVAVQGEPPLTVEMIFDVLFSVFAVNLVMCVFAVLKAWMHWVR